MVEFVCKKFHELSLDELYSLLALRQEVFVVEQNCIYLDTDDLDQTSWHLLGLGHQRKLIAYARLIPQGLVYKNYVAVGRIATSPSVRGTGIGKVLMQEILEKTGSLFKGQPVKISAQSYLLAFYESFGFQKQGEEYLEDGIPHIAMVLK